MKVCIDCTKTALLHTLQNESVRKQVTTNGKSCDDSSISGSSTAPNNDDNDAFSKSEIRNMPALTTPPNNLSTTTKNPVELPSTPQKETAMTQNSSDLESLL